MTALRAGDIVPVHWLELADEPREIHLAVLAEIPAVVRGPNTPALWPMATTFCGRSNQGGPLLGVDATCGKCRTVVAELEARRNNPAEPSALDAAMHSVYLHGDWRWLTKKMTTDEREAAADAVDRYDMWMQGQDPNLNTGPIERWWRE